jgi:hypothetical protein
MFRVTGTWLLIYLSRTVIRAEFWMMLDASHPALSKIQGLSY